MPRHWWTRCTIRVSNKKPLNRTNGQDSTREESNLLHAHGFTLKARAKPQAGLQTADLQRAASASEAKSRCFAEADRKIIDRKILGEPQRTGMRDCFATVRSIFLSAIFLSAS